MREDAWSLAEGYVSAAASGYPAAFDSIVIAVEASLRAFIVRAVGPPQHLLDDIVQGTLFEIYKSLPRFERRSSFKTWCYAIAWRTARSHLRATGPTEYSLDEAGADAPAATDVAGEVEARQMAARLLRMLSPDRACVLYLRYCEDMADSEIARVLAIPVGTVASRASRGLAELRALTVSERT